MTLLELSELDVRDVDPANLVNINDVEIDMDLPPALRIAEVYRQMKGYPYHFICQARESGKPIIVKATFPQTETSLNDCLTSHFRTL
jgi:hypothetical protein